MAEDLRKSYSEDDLPTAPWRFPFSGVARPKLMVGPDYRGTKEVLEDLALAAG